MSQSNVTQEAQRPKDSRFTIPPNLGDLLDAATDMEEVAERLHAAGFQPIPLGGVHVVDKWFDAAGDAEAYVSSCIEPIQGKLVGRRTHGDGRIQLRVCIPTTGGTRDRTKEPEVPRWPDIPFSPHWWRDREAVPLPQGWKNWGKKKGGKVVAERYGCSERNVGIRTGSDAGLVVIDIDKKDGRDGLLALREEFGEEFEKLFPPTFSVETPTGGLHWFYRTDAKIHNSASHVAPGVDVRGEGGYVVGPRSMRMSGGRYSVVNCVPPVPLPEKTLQLLLSLRPARTEGRRRSGQSRLTSLSKDDALKRLLEQFQEVPSGQRHDVLVRAAGVARNLVEDDEDLAWTIRNFAEQRGVTHREPEDLERIVEDAKGWDRRAADGAKQVIVVDLDEARVVREFEEAIASAPGLYQRGQALVTIVEPRRGSKTKQPSIAPIARAVLRTASTELVEWVQLKLEEGEEGQEDQVTEVPIRPPAWAVSSLHAQRRWPTIRWLEGVVDYPVLLRDGTVLTEPGYDADSGLYLAAQAVPLTLPEKPALSDAKAALDELAEIYCDFPFADNASRSAALAGILTPLARHAVDGPVPMFAFDKAARGTGGSLMADCVGELLNGRTMPRMIHAATDEEMRKVITSLMIEGATLVLLDNVAGPLGTPALDALLTGTTWKDRLLGTNEMVVLPSTCVLYATGNNLILAGDTSRRVLRIRLESPLENPEDRSDFKHPDLLGWIRRERPRLLGAALTVLRAYVLGGFPDQELQPWGSFEEWSSLVRGCLVWAGWPDPAEARATGDAELDGDKQVMVDVILGLEALLRPGEQLTAREIFERLRQTAPISSADVDPFPGLRAVLTGSNGKLLPPKLITAGFLRKFKGRVWDGRTIASKHNRTKTSEWFVRSFQKTELEEATSGAEDHAEQPSGEMPTSGNGMSHSTLIDEYLDVVQ